MPAGGGGGKYANMTCEQVRAILGNNTVCFNSTSMRRSQEHGAAHWCVRGGGVGGLQEIAVDLTGWVG